MFGYFIKARLVCLYGTALVHTRNETCEILTYMLEKGVKLSLENSTATHVQS